jgi:hypothetical protein
MEICSKICKENYISRRGTVTEVEVNICVTNPASKPDTYISVNSNEQ